MKKVEEPGMCEAPSCAPECGPGGTELDISIPLAAEGSVKPRGGDESLTVASGDAQADADRRVSVNSVSEVITPVQRQAKDSFFDKTFGDAPKSAFKSSAHPGNRSLSPSGNKRPIKLRLSKHHPTETYGLEGIVRRDSDGTALFITSTPRGKIKEWNDMQIHEGHHRKVIKKFGRIIRVNEVEGNAHRMEAEIFKAQHLELFVEATPTREIDHHQSAAESPEDREKQKQEKLELLKKFVAASQLAQAATLDIPGASFAVNPDRKCGWIGSAWQNLFGTASPSAPATQSETAAVSSNAA